MKPAILIVGDLMLDEDTHFVSVRTSGEGVPVVALESSEQRPGGAAAVAVMAAGMGAEVYLSGVVGSEKGKVDRTGEALLMALAGHKIRSRIAVVKNRPTTFKNRIFVDDLQVVRYDSESTEPLGGPALASLVSGWPEQVDVALISDYAKGVITPELMNALRRLYPGKPIIVDPRGDGDWEMYGGVACLTPNRHEFAGKSFEFICSRAVLKRDSEGLIYREALGDAREFPAITGPAELVDVCGAGDMVLAALGFCVASGFAWDKAAEFANIAAGLKCRRRGAVAVSWDEICDFAGCQKFGVPVA